MLPTNSASFNLSQLTWDLSWIPANDNIIISIADVVVAVDATLTAAGTAGTII